MSIIVLVNNILCLEVLKMSELENVNNSVLRAIYISKNLPDLYVSIIKAKYLESHEIYLIITGDSLEELQSQFNEIEKDRLLSYCSIYSTYHQGKLIQ